MKTLREFLEEAKQFQVEEGKWDYPKHMTKTVTTSDMDTTNAARNREERKAWRKKEKAKAHAVLMKGMRKEEVEQIDEAADIELKPHPNGTQYVVHKIHPKSGIESDQLKVGEKIHDTHVDDLHDMGYRVKIHKK